jgi:multidrug efflux pump subunit AcrA (membrane-fusion protein)
VIALCLILLGLIVAIGRDVLFPSPSSLASLRTATVDTGAVAVTVTGTGTLTPAAQQALNFRVSGVLSEVDVRVGDTVSPGQILARVDPTAQQLALTQAQSQLQQAQSQLDATQNGTALQNAQNTLSQAQQSYDDTSAQVTLTNQQDANQIGADQQRVSQAQSQYAADGCGTAKPASTCQADQQTLTSAQTALQTDQNRQQQDQLSGQQKLHQGQNAITNAQVQVNQQTVTRRTTIASQQAAVDNAQAQVDNAQQNLNYTTLTSPMGGTVMAVNGVVGSSVSGGGTSPSSSASSSSSTGQGAGGQGGPGSTSGASPSSSSSSSGAASSSGSGFIAISDVSTFQVSAPFAETDASRIQPSQRAQLTFDAVSGLTIPGSVASVAPTATVSSNVTDYAVTLALNQIDSRLKQGMTANVTVTVNSVTGAVRVPNAAIRNVGGQQSVTLVTSRGTQTAIPVQTGLVGDTYTEVTSGLSPGDVVLLPQLTTGTSGGTGGGGVRLPGGGGGGGGGGRGGLGGGGG